MNRDAAIGPDAGGWQSWPSLRAPQPAAPVPAPPLQTPPTEDLQALRERAYREAYAAGLEAGRAAGSAELAARAVQLEVLCAALERPLAEVGTVLEAELAALVTTLVRHLVRRELRADPSVIVAVVRDAVALLPVSQQRPRIHLHPDDAALVRELLHLEGEERAWSLVEDPAVTRGGCRVRTEDSAVDATLETRLARLCAAVLGGERAGEVAA
ncbi:MAG: hypothetical protein AMXMBFR26_06270 [Porticoccaceae bacterium]